MDCTTTLAVKAEGSIGVPDYNVVIPYKRSGGDFILSDSWMNFFSSEDNTNCPVTSCILMESTCSTEMTAETNLLIGSSSPWMVSAKQNIVDGWKKSFCLKCIGTAQSGFFSVIQGLQIR